MYLSWHGWCMTSSLMSHRSLNYTMQHFSLNSFLVLLFDTRMSYLKRQREILSANKYYGNLPFISINVSCRKTAPLKTFPWIFPHPNFIKKKYFHIRSIKWSKCWVYAPCTLSSSIVSNFTPIFGSTISISSVAKPSFESLCGTLKLTIALMFQSIPGRSHIGYDERDRQQNSHRPLDWSQQKRGRYVNYYFTPTSTPPTPPWTKWLPIWQTTFLNAFSWMKMMELRFEFHWKLFPGVQLTISQHWFG